MKLLKEYYDEDEFDDEDDYEEESEFVLIVYYDQDELTEYNNQYQADGHFAELDEMSDDELLDEGIFGVVRLTKDSEGELFVTDTRYVDGKEFKVDKAIQKYTSKENK